MNNDQLREKLTARRQEHIDAMNKRTAEIKLLAAENRITLAGVTELDYALEALDQAPAPATPEKPQEQAPRELAADAILASYASDDLPSAADDLFGTLHAQFTMRTLRAGLEVAHRHRKKEPLAKHGESRGRSDATGAARVAESASLPASGTIQESRAAARPAESDAETDRSSQRTLETATPTNDGAGAESVDTVEAERPVFLTRAKAAAE